MNFPNRLPWMKESSHYQENPDEIQFHEKTTEQGSPYYVFGIYDGENKKIELRVNPEDGHVVPSRRK
jgi:hypothetical protein